MSQALKFEYLLILFVFCNQIVVTLLTITYTYRNIIMPGSVLELYRLISSHVCGKRRLTDVI